MIAALMFSKKNKLKKDDEIIVPAVSWSTTFFPLQQYGLKLIFVDISANSFNIDPVKVEKALSAKTKAIFAVNLYGNPCDYKTIQKICKTHNLILLEDNCESLGAKYNSKFTGTFGLMSSFSFFFSHHISTMEGGMILTDNKELFHILLCLRAHGWTRSLPKRNLISLKNKSDSFYDLFNFVLPGYNLRPLELSAAIGIEQLKKLPTLIKARRKNAEYFKKIFSKIKSVIIQKEIGLSSWFCFGIIFKGSRAELLAKLIKFKIEFRPIVSGNFTKNIVIKYFKYKIKGKLINSDLVHSNGISFGNSHLNLKKKIDTLAKIFYQMK
jgi:CDP-6-deoxy-D-xylo-4-hexulose-3-dehydrase